jgi:hypothetical protein
MASPRGEGPSPIERATEGVMARLNAAIADEAETHGLNHFELRRVLAGYFERKSLREWCGDLHIDPPAHERDR